MTRKVIFNNQLTFSMKTRERNDISYDTEEELRQSEEKYKRTFMTANVGISLTDPDGALKNVNNAFCEMLGYTREELSLMGFKAVTYPDDLPETERCVKLLLSGERDSYRMQKRYIRKDGEIIWADVSTMMLRDNNGIPLHFVTHIIDITDHKRLEQEKFRLIDIIENTLNEIYLFSATTLKFEYVNPAGIKNLGYSFNELREMTPVDIKPEFTPEKFKKLITPLYKKETSEIVFETLNRRKNGTFYPVEVHLQYLEQEERKFFNAIVNDISYRIKAEADIREKEKLYRKLFENMLNGFAYCKMIYDGDEPVDFIYLSVNEAFSQLTGLVGVEGKKVTEIIPSIMEQDPGLIRIYGRVSLTGNPEVFETFVESLNMWFSISAYCPEAGYFVAVFDVITDRKNTELNGYLVKEVLEILNSVTDSVEMINLTIRKIKDKSGIEAVAVRLKEGNDFPYFSTIGFPEDFVKAEKYLCCYDREGRLLCDKDDKPLLECMCGNILEGRTDPSKSFFTKEGSFVSGNTTRLLAETTEEDRMARTRNRCNSSGYESVALIPIRSGNEIVGLLQLNDHRTEVFNADMITFFESLGASIGLAIIRNRAMLEIRNLNEELENRVAIRTLQLEEANRELEAFSYSVSHDLRAPLRSVHSFTNILLEEYEQKLDDEGRRLCKVISTSAVQMGTLIDDLLNFSKVGRGSISHSLIDMKMMAESVYAEISTEKDRDRIKLVLKDIGPAKGDVNLIRQVWVNLISNAIKYSSKSQKPVIEIGFSPDHGMKKYYVRDNGVGFDMNYSDKLFGVFHRLHSTTEFEGNGVGLAIVKRIIVRHGGDAWAEGEPGKGAVFYFSLPG